MILPCPASFPGRTVNLLIHHISGDGDFTVDGGISAKFAILPPAAVVDVHLGTPDRLSAVAKPAIKIAVVGFHKGSIGGGHGMLRLLFCGNVAILHVQNVGPDHMKGGDRSFRSPGMTLSIVIVVAPVKCKPVQIG